jgi:hypothetical protein
MRTTVTLDPDVELLVKRAMKDRGISFKEAVNEAIRAGAGGTVEPVEFPTFAMGRPSVDITKALRIAGELEDDELARRLASGR